MMLSRIPFSFGRRPGDATPTMPSDAVIPRLGNVAPQLAWLAREAHGVPLGQWTRG